MYGNSRNFSILIVLILILGFFPLLAEGDDSTFIESITSEFRIPIQNSVFSLFNIFPWDNRNI